MIRQCLIIIISCLLTVQGFSQSKIYLQHKLKPNRQKKISTERNYTFQTSDSIYNSYRILSFSDSTLVISSLSQGDTLMLAISDILFLKKDKKVGVFEVTAYLGVVLLTITPIVWALEGNEAALGTLEGVAVLALFSVPVLLLKEIGRKKDTKHKWSIRTV